MKTMLIIPKNESEFRFLSDLLKKLQISSSTMTIEDLEDMALSKLLKKTDKTKKASYKSVISKLKL